MRRKSFRLGAFYNPAAVKSCGVFFFFGLIGADSDRSGLHAWWLVFRPHALFHFDRLAPYLVGKSYETYGWRLRHTRRVGVTATTFYPCQSSSHRRDQAPVTLFVRGRLRSQEWKQTHLTNGRLPPTRRLHPVAPTSLVRSRSFPIRRFVCVSPLPLPPSPSHRPHPTGRCEGEGGRGDPSCRA
jgi:hypothetical protein